MRSLAAIAFSFSVAILLLCLLPMGSWPFWAAAGLAVIGICILLLPSLCSCKRFRFYLALITLSMAFGLLYGRGWSALVSDPVQSAGKPGFFPPRCATGRRPQIPAGESRYA